MDEGGGGVAGEKGTSRKSEMMNKILHFYQCISQPIHYSVSPLEN